ncbi:putative FAD-dependent dehydrogenase [Desulfohalotomaculum tongense]|uniref:FAD-dependent protein n=1 Tax=Desulforadius tongensis TaxID=1216062 RepID=UPI001959F16D|nr:putative FAD-dependent dehydrogenase [Desulforadius tongensis]
MRQQYDVIIVGAGPAGIFSALELVKNKQGVKVLIVEKGRDIAKRICPSREKKVPCVSCDPCSTVCGWGGAGAFSDGKLTLSSAVGGNLDSYIGKPRLEEYIKYVDDIYLEFGAPEKVYGLGQEEEIEKIKRQALEAELKLVPMPIRHLGTGRCMEILQNMQDYLAEKGVEIATDCAVDQVLVKDNRAVGIKTAGGEEFYGKNVILAPGREGADWLQQEAKRLNLTTAVNPVDIGVRVELPASVMEHLTKVVYESKFLYTSKTFDDQVRTFCMNPYGEVVTENNDGLITVNGHSHAYRKTENTNFAVLVTKTFTQPFKDPIKYGRYISSLANLLSGGVIVQRLGDLLSGRRSTESRIKKGLVEPTLTEAVPGDLSLVFPYRHLMAIVEMLEAMDKIAPGVFSRFTLLYGVEVKFYSFRLALKNNLETHIQNLYAAGDGAGVTRGLVQASVAGVVTAREILKSLYR